MAQNSRFAAANTQYTTERPRSPDNTQQKPLVLLLRQHSTTRNPTTPVDFFRIYPS